MGGNPGLSQVEGGSGEQLVTARQLAVLQDRQQDSVARDHFGVARLEDLISVQASPLIAELPKRTR